MWGSTAKALRLLTAFLITIATLLVSGPVGAQVVEGGGPKSTDCFVTYDSIPTANYPSANPRHVRCADQDVSCGDADARLGYCQFQLRLTLNSDNFAGCSPTNLPTGGFLIPFSGPMNDDHPKNVADFEVFQQFAEDQLPLTPADSNIMSAFSDVTVPMQIAFTGNGPMFRTTTITMHPTMCTVPLNANGKCVSPGIKDVDTFNLTCTPPLDPMTGAKISPCTSITSTFQQIQEHILDRKCSTQASCHGSAIPPHDLCLRSSCNAGTRSAYTDLVGVAPANFFANEDGLKRVDPGDPGNSLIVHKINGGAQLNSPVSGPLAYGVRMPFNNPAIDRARPKLSHGEIKLITDWIMAGAPQTGFVATTAAGACH
jgi:hypothetical protein